MIKIIVRSILYPWIILFTGIMIGFICNSEWVGYKYLLIERSFCNIFAPIQYNEKIEAFVKDMGQLRLCAELDYPKDFRILDEVVVAQEFYWAKYQYTDKKGKQIVSLGSTRVRWKTWEYYYGIDEVLDKEKK